MRKDIIKSLIAIRQSEIPFDVIERDIKLPVDRKKIITIPGVRRCGKSTMMEIAVNNLVRKGISRQNILWIGFDDERLINMSSDELDDVIVSYMEMFPDIPIKDVHMFFDEIQLIKNWEYFILRVYKSYCKNIYICGSNATMLSSELGSALRGYPLEYETYPLSFNEYCRFKKIATNSFLEQDKARLKSAFEEYNRASAFPEIVLTHSKSEQTKLLHGYFDTMIYTNSEELQSLQYFLLKAIQTSSMTEGMPPEMMERLSSQTLSLAAIILSIIPVFCFFPLIRKNFASGIMVGSLKG